MASSNTDINAIQNYESDGSDSDSQPPQGPPPYEDLDQEVTLEGSIDPARARAMELQQQQAAIGDDGDVSSMGDREINSTTDDDKLSCRHICNLLLCLLAWACTVCNNTIVVGISPLVMLSIGSASRTSSLPLGAFFVGTSLVSVLVTPFIFRRGRKLGFVVGAIFGMIGTALGCVSTVADSVGALLAANLFFGASTGIGFYLRFAAVEVVPRSFAARAVTLVVGGGCFAAFAGPESAQASVDLFPSHPFLGAFIVTGIFYVLNLMLSLAIKFTKSVPATTPDGDDTRPTRRELRSIMSTRQFIIPLITSSVAWAGMAMPMSLVRVAMGEVGFSTRQSLTTLELHFLGMFMTGLLMGRFISKFGPPMAAYGAVIIFSIADMILLLVKAEDDGSVANWMVGLTLLGVAWNFGFTGSTIWLTEAYKERPQYKTWVQSANESMMFAFAGIWIFSTSYIAEAGGGGLRGWQCVVLTSVALVWMKAAALFWDRRQENKREYMRDIVVAYEEKHNRQDITDVEL